MAKSRKRIHAGIQDLGNGEYHILIPIAPYTKKNHQQIIVRKTGTGTSYPQVIPSKEYRNYANSCRMFLRPLHIDYPVNVQAYYYVPTRRRCDLINYHAALHDILVEAQVVEDDNAWIIVGTDGSRVFYDKEFPRTELWIQNAERTFEQAPRYSGKSIHRPKK